MVLRTPKDRFSGEIVSPGIAKGQIFLLDIPTETSLSHEKTDGELTPSGEIDRFSQQVASLTHDLRQTVNSLESESLSAGADGLFHKLRKGQRKNAIAEGAGLQNHAATLLLGGERELFPQFVYDIVFSAHIFIT
jgi:hypothetical protein